MRPELVTTARCHAICFSLLQVCILPKSTEAPLTTQLCILWAALELTLILSISLACFPNTLREGISQWMKVFSTLIWFVYTLNSNLSQHLGTLVNSYHLMGLYFKRWSLLLDFSYLSLYRIYEFLFSFKK